MKFAGIVAGRSSLSENKGHTANEKVGASGTATGWRYTVEESAVCPK
jgi:hypothetical protein